MRRRGLHPRHVWELPKAREDPGKAGPPVWETGLPAHPAPHPSPDPYPGPGSDQAQVQFPARHRQGLPCVPVPRPRLSGRRLHRPPQDRSLPHALVSGSGHDARAGAPVADGTRLAEGPDVSARGSGKFGIAHGGSYPPIFKSLHLRAGYRMLWCNADSGGQGRRHGSWGAARDPAGESGVPPHPGISADQLDEGPCATSDLF